jgi:hypothetical protein
MADVGDRDDTAVRAGHVAGALFLMTAAFVLAKTGRDALYFQGDGLYGLPKAYLGVALLSVPTALLMLDLMRRLGPRRARVVSAALVAALLAGFHRVVHPGAGVVMTTFFMFVPLAFGVLFSVSWLLAADLMEGRPRDRLASAYGLIGAASVLGGVAGSVLARVLATGVEPATMILLAATSLAGSAAVMALTQARYPPPAAVPVVAAPVPDRPSRAFRALLGERYAALLVWVGMLGALAGILVDFQLYLAAATSGGSGRENARFFANIYLLLNGAALVVQLSVLPAIQRAIGVHGSLLVLPVAVLGAALSLFGGASLLSRSLLRVTEGGLRSSIHRVSWEQAYLPLDSARRGVAKVWVDGAAVRIAEGVGALVLLSWLHLAVGGGSLVGRSTAWLTWMLVAVLVAWVVVSRRLGVRLKAATAEMGAPPERIDVPLPDT